MPMPGKSPIAEETLQENGTSASNLQTPWAEVFLWLEVLASLAALTMRFYKRNPSRRLAASNAR
jgi:hypothetical protein